MASISLCMIVRDEAEVLARCLESARGVADELVVVDTGSTDETAAIAERFGARVERFEWCDDFAAARNRSFDLASCPYILWLDADDVLLPADRERLLDLKPRLASDIYFLRYDYAQDEHGSSLCSLWRERIVCNRPDVRWRHPVHEFLSIAGLSWERADITVTHRRTPRGAAGDRSRNLRILERAVELPEYRGEPRIAYYLGREYVDAGEPRRALDCFERFLAQPDGWEEDRVTALQKSAGCWRQLAAAEPESAAAHRERARALARAARRADPRRAEPLLLLGDVAFDDGDLGEAVFWYEQAMRPLPDLLGPVDAYAYGLGPAVQLCRCHDLRGDFRRAHYYNELALGLRPDDPGLLHNRRYLRGKLDAAETRRRLSFGAPRPGAVFCAEIPDPAAEDIFPAAAIPRPDGCIDSIHYSRVPRGAEAAALLREWARVLAPGGEAVLEGEPAGSSNVEIALAIQEAGLVVDYAWQGAGGIRARAVKPRRPERIAFVAGAMPLTVPQYRIRIFQVAGWLRSQGYRAELIHPGPLDGYAAVVFFRAYTAEEHAGLVAARAAGRRTILDVCEDLLDMPDRMPWYRPMIEAAGTVVCCSHILAERLRTVNPNVVVIEDAVEEGFADDCAYTGKRRITVGWIGMGGNEPNAERLRPLIEAAGHQLLTIHDRPSADVPWRPDTWRDTLLRCDAAIAPLDVASQPSKSNNKVTTCMALGLPVVASPLDAYRRVIRHGENGLLADSEEDWRDAFARLADPAERERLGRAGKAAARAWSIEAIGERWRSLLFDAQRVEGVGRPLVVIHTGRAFEPWNGATLDRAGIGGSETAAARMATELSRLGHRVVVFGRAEGLEGTVDGVEYLDGARYPAFAALHAIDVLVISRYADLLDVPVRAGQTWFWAHDTRAIAADDGGMDRLLRHSPRLDGVFCLSEWHREVFARGHGLPLDKIAVIRNGIDLERFAGRERRRRNRFIYSSSPDRGLDVLLALFPRIRAELPDAELHVFYGFDNWDRSLAERDSPQERAWRDAIRAGLHQEGVFAHGRVGQARLAREMMRADIWFYPTRFSETYCITALEAQMAGVVCVCTDLGALRTTVGERGILIPGDAYSAEYCDRAVEEVLGVLRDRRRRQAMAAVGRRWARRQTWAALALEWALRFGTLPAP